MCKSHSCVLKSHFAFRNYTRACVHHTQEWFLHAECGINTYECHNHTYTCQHQTPHVKNSFMRVEISVVSVVVTVVRVEITLCVWKLHSACRNYTLRVEIALYIHKSNLCVLKSHFAFRNCTCASVHHSMRVEITHNSYFYRQSVVLTRLSVITLVHVEITVVSVNHNCAFQHHTSCGNYTLRVEITLCVWKFHSTYINHPLACLNHTLACWNHTLVCWNHTMRVEITLLRVEITLCVQNLHLRVCSSNTKVNSTRIVWFLHTCQHHTLRVEFTLLCVEITGVSVVITFVR
jgi:hypothetical protein